MKTKKKLKKIEASELLLAFDECHKVYFILDERSQREAVAYGYSFYPTYQLRSILDRCCGLVFVRSWSFDPAMPDHPWDIAQGELYESGYYDDNPIPDD